MSDVANDSVNTEYKSKTTLNGDSFTNVIYENKLNPSFTQTRALFIANMDSNMDTGVFKSVLEEEASRENCTIERAWLNSMRTYCYVLVSDVPGATAIRSRLNSQTLNADETADIKLYVDYIPVRALDIWIEQEVDAPKDAIWKISYVSTPSKINVGTTFQKVIHEMINYENTTSGYVKTQRRKNHDSNRQSHDLFVRKYERMNDRHRNPKNGYRSNNRREYGHNETYRRDMMSDRRGGPRGGDYRSKPRRADVYIPDY